MIILMRIPCEITGLSNHIYRMEDCDSIFLLVTDKDTNEFVINPENTSSRPCLPARQANADRVGGGSSARRTDVSNGPQIIPVYVGVSLLPPSPHPSGHTAAGTSAAFVPPRIWCTPEGSSTKSIGTGTVFIQDKLARHRCQFRSPWQSFQVLGCGTSSDSETNLTNATCVISTLCTVMTSLLTLKYTAYTPSGHWIPWTVA